MVDVLIGIGLIIFYLFPCVVAGVRNTKNSSWVFIINLFLGVTVIGWVVAFVMACEGKKRA